MNELIRLANCHLDTLDSVEILVRHIFHKKQGEKHNKEKSQKELGASWKVRAQ